MKTHLSILFFFVLLISHCHKNPSTPQTTSQLKIKSLIESEQITKFSYTDNLLTMKETFRSPESMDAITTSNYIYNEKGQLVQQDFFSPLPAYRCYFTSIYEYSGERIQKEWVYQGYSNRLSSYIFYEYDNRHITKYSYYSPVSVLFTYHLLEYENGNITKDAYYDKRDSLLILQTYEYDDKINPLSVDTSPISASTFSKNNIIRHEETVNMTKPPNVYTTMNTYTYNNDDYPEKCFVSTSEIQNGITHQDTSTTYYVYFE